MDLSEFAKNAKTTDEITVDRLKCILSKNAVKIKQCKRRYLQALPYYIEEREKRLAEFDEIQARKTGGFSGSPPKEGVAPLPTFDSALDPEAIFRAE
mgnify:CR=1 FL=1|jgi:hypothetical protein